MKVIQRKSHSQIGMYWTFCIYVGLVIVLLLLIGYMVYRVVYRDFAGSVITLRFNIYEGVTVIENVSHILNYLWIAIGIGVCNVFIAILMQIKVYMNKNIQMILTHWLFGSTIMALILIGYYLFLVIEINS